MSGFHLVFHREHGQASVFDAALRSVIAGSQEILLASPYIGLRYLQSLVAGLAFRLVTDLDEWLRSSPGQSAAIHEYIQAQRDNIRHVAGLHAKVTVGHSSAFFGSANFTRAGMTRRDEMSAVVTDPDGVAELKLWFEDLWQRAVVPDLDELQSIVMHMAKQRIEAPRTPRLRAKGQGSRATLRIPGVAITETPATEQRQLNYVFKPQPGLFGDLVQHLSEHPASRVAALEPHILGVLLDMLETRSAVTFRQLMRQLRDDGVRYDAATAERALAPHIANGRLLLSAENDGELVLQADGYCTTAVAKDFIQAMDSYLAWLLSRLSPDEYKPWPKSETAGHFKIEVELAERLKEALLENGFVAKDQADMVVLTGEASWGKLPSWLPQFAAAWLNAGLALDDTPDALQVSAVREHEDLVLYAIRALQSRAMPRDARKWPKDPVGLLDRPGNRDFLAALLETELVQHAMNEGKSELVLFNPASALADDFERNGMLKAAALVRTPSAMFKKALKTIQLQNRL